MIESIKLKIITNNRIETLFIDNKNENDKIMKLIFDIPLIKFNSFKFRYKCLAMYNGKCIRNNTPKEIFGKIISAINTFLLGTLISKDSKRVGSKQLCKLNGHSNIYKKNIIKFLGFPFNSIILEDRFCTFCENSCYPYIDAKQCAYINFPYNFLYLSDIETNYEEDTIDEETEKDEPHLPWLFSPSLLLPKKDEKMADDRQKTNMLNDEEKTNILNFNLDSSVNILVCYCEENDCNGGGISNCPIRSGGQHLKKVCKDCAPFYLANQKSPPYWSPIIKIMDENLPNKKKLHDILQDTLIHLEI